MKFLIRLIPVLLIIILSISLLISTFSNSPTYDELTHINAGYQFLVNHDFRYDPINPPLARELVALPALINYNLTFNHPTLLPARLVVILFTLALAVIVYLFSKKLYGVYAALLSLTLITLDPNILANGGVATTDLIFTFFYLLSIYLFYLLDTKFTYSKLIIFAVTFGPLLSTKTTAIVYILLPILIIKIINYRTQKKYKLFTKNNLKIILIFTAISTLSLWATYFFKQEPLLGYRFDQNRPAIALAENNALVKFALTEPVPLGSYVSSIKQILVVNYSGLYSNNSMILGNIEHNGQPGYYFIPLIFIKTPIPLIIMLLLSLYLFRKRLIKDKYVLIPLVTVILFALISRSLIVYRYLLPMVPLMIIYIGQLADYFLNKKNKKRIYLLAFLVIWFVIESTSAFPHYLSYINLSLGGTNSGYRYVFDANYDWGQGLIALKKFQDMNPDKRLLLDYFGQNDPARYGIKYTKLTPSSIENIEALDNSILAISTTNWYLGGYYKDPIFNNHKPDEIIGGSILIFK